MAIVFVVNGRRAILGAWMGDMNTFLLRLFKNDYTPLITSVVGDFVEADFAGYAEVALTAWGAIFTNANNQAETDEEVNVFTKEAGGSANTIYGYYVTDSSGVLMWAERNPAGGQVMSATGDTYSVLPRFMEGTLGLP